MHPGDRDATQPGSAREHQARLLESHLQQPGLLGRRQDRIDHMLDLVEGHVAHQVFGRLQLREVLRGELGHLADAPRYDQASNADLMTQPQEVPPFIEQTGIDLLAVSVGTAHGMYAPGVKPKLDFDRLAQIQRVSSVPLALHGGSGTPFDQLQRCAEFGVAKINVGAAVFEADRKSVV